MAMKRQLQILLAVLVLWTSTNSATAETITFDELDVSKPIPTPYFGMAWNFNLLETPFRTWGGGSGYDNGVVSPPVVAYSGGAIDRSFASFGPGRGHGSFTFVSAELTGAWHDGLNIHIVGLFDGAVVNTADVVVDATGPTHVELNWSGLDMLEFTSSGGVLHDPDWLEGAMFVMDDAVVTDVISTLIPEPSTWVLAGMGWGACLIRRFLPQRRRTRQWRYRSICLTHTRWNGNQIFSRQHAQRGAPPQTSPPHEPRRTPTGEDEGHLRGGRPPDDLTHRVTHRPFQVRN
jgi:hypothetical protein